MPIFALTTDFGWGSSYVAQLKGVLLSAHPAATIVDVSHAVPAQSIRAAELLLRSTAFAFPLGTVHLVICDPGVGTSRRPLAVAARGTFFVGPDNGVLETALSQPGATCVSLDVPELFRAPVSSTFHGRDVFAPVAAELAAGAALTDVGRVISDPVRGTLPHARREGDEVVGEIVGADVFGNLLTNVPGPWADATQGLRLENRRTQRVETYGAAPVATLVTLVGSDGFLELAVRDGSAQALLGATAVGSEARIRSRS